MINKLTFDAIVIGGGFYGSMVALHLSKVHGFKKVGILELNDDIFERASLNNQYRIHNGYHYPRSYNTANRSRINFERFMRDWPQEIIDKNITSLYAIPKENSKINASQFLKFCRSINAKINVASKDHQRLFHTRKFDEVFEVEEYCFNPEILKDEVKKDLHKEEILTYLGKEVFEISEENENLLKVCAYQADKSIMNFYSNKVFNCSYSGLGQIRGDLAGLLTNLKHEVAEIVFVELPKKFSSFGITIMDGPFFSFLPTNKDKVHSFSHVRYSPHLAWQDSRGVNPYQRIESLKKSTRFERMIRSAQKFMPNISKTKYLGSRFEIKTILEKNEVDDGRPILFEKDINLRNLYYVLGSKIDNIYDVLEKIDSELEI